MPANTSISVNSPGTVKPNTSTNISITVNQEIPAQPIPLLGPDICDTGVFETGVATRVKLIEDGGRVIETQTECVRGDSKFNFSFVTPNSPGTSETYTVIAEGKNSNEKWVNETFTIKLDEEAPSSSQGIFEKINELLRKFEIPGLDYSIAGIPVGGIAIFAIIGFMILKL